MKHLGTRAAVVPQMTDRVSTTPQHAHLLTALMPRRPEGASRRSLRYATGPLAAAMPRQRSLPTLQAAPLSLCAAVRPLTRHPEAHQARMDTMPQVGEASRPQEAAAAARPRAELCCGRRPTWGHRPGDDGGGGDLDETRKCFTARERPGLQTSCQDGRAQLCRDSKRCDCWQSCILLLSQQVMPTSIHQTGTRRP